MHRIRAALLFAVVASLTIVLATAVSTRGAAAGKPTVDLRFVGSSIGDFFLNQSAPGAVSEVPDPAGSGETVLKMTVDNSDVYPLTPTNNPRSQLVTPPLIKPGSTFWWRSKFFLPRDFPNWVPGWLVLLEGPYGEPFDGTPPWHIEVNHNEIHWSRNGNYDWDVPWQMPLVKGRWINVLMHCRFSGHGYVDMWVDGRRVTFFDGSTYNPNHVHRTRRLRMATRDHSNDEGSNFAVLMSYREANMFRTVTVYQGQTAIGPTFASVRR
jgi:hypothetical protein